MKFFKTIKLSSKVFFPNLNGIRFIAAFAVIIHHIEQLRYIFNVENYWENSSIKLIGKLGVVLFFVLSGFLITYLILKEKEITKTIAVKAFYIRRMLRIWPLYYLIFSLAFFILPHFKIFDIPNLSNELHNYFITKSLLYIFFFPNLALTVFAPIPYASQAWSIGVEEQFYLIWPILIKIFKNIIYMLLGVIFVYLVIKGLLLMLPKFIPNNNYLTIATNFWGIFSIDCMAIGGIGAWVLYNEKNTVLNILFNKYFQFLIYLLLILFIVYGVYIPYLHYEVYAILFAIIIVNLAANKRSIINLENSFFNYLGKISYGLYMFHFLAIVICFRFLQKINILDHITHYLLSITLTIIVSSVSYHVFELWFIKRKIQYSKVLSGENAA